MKKVSLLILTLLVAMSVAFAQQNPSGKTQPKPPTTKKKAPPPPQKKKSPPPSKSKKSPPPSKGKGNTGKAQPAPKGQTAATPKKVVNNFPKRNIRRLSLTVMGGVPQLFTDLERFQNKQVYGFALNYKLTHSVGIRVGYATGQWYRGQIASDTVVYKNSYSEISALAVFNIGNINFLGPKRPFQIYSYIGYAMLLNNASLYYKSTPAITRAKLKDHTNAIPIGIGLKLKLSNSFDFMVESGIRITQSDSVDLWNPSSGTFGNKSYDWYAFHMVGLTYHIGRKAAEPLEWTNPVRYMYDELASMKKTVDALKIDNDNDGVSDFFDREPNTPDSVNVYGSGRAVDTDRDGIPDNLDAEPYSDPGAVVDASGKSADSDGDGVPDHRDKEPGTDSTMLANHQGIGIMSKEMLEQLKNVPKESQQKMFQTTVGKIGYLPAIFFETDEFEVPSRYYADLYGVAHALRNYPEAKLYVIGGADMRKDEAYNLELARKRAQSVADILSKKFGIDRNRLVVQTLGKKDPLVDGKRKDAMAANRRVTFKVVE